MLDHHAPVPLYHQLAHLLEEQVRSGALREGDRIASEPELARRYGIGRPTVRQATELLVRRGMLQRRRGAGTFVRKPEPSVDMLNLGGTLASIRDSGMPIETRSLGPLAPRDGALHLKRVHHFAGSAQVLEELRLDAEVFGQLSGRSFERDSLSEAVRGELGLRLDHARQSVGIAVARGEIARSLGVAEGTPLLHVERTLVFGGVGEVAKATLLCRTDELRFTQTLQGEST